MSQQQPNSLSARGRSFEFTMVFARTADDRTRVTIKRTPDSKDEVTRLLNQLCDTLLEPHQ
jgi:hypothetical protein